MKRQPGKMDQALTTNASDLDGGQLYRGPLRPAALSRAVSAETACLHEIAFYYLNNERATEQTRQRYQDALRWLEAGEKVSYKLGVDSAIARP